MSKRPLSLAEVMDLFRPTQLELVLGYEKARSFAETVYEIAAFLRTRERMLNNEVFIKEPQTQLPIAQTPRAFRIRYVRPTVGLARLLTVDAATPRCLTTQPIRVLGN